MGAFSKETYVTRNFQKISGKRWELYVITRVIHSLNDPDIEYVCQQYINPPKNNEYYLGAGSEINHKENYKSKIGTILYLLNAAKNEIITNISKLNFTAVLGFRPFSFDGQPIFGKFNKDISIISGTKRDGLTLAPLIVEEILKEVQMKNYSSKLFD